MNVYMKWNRMLGTRDERKLAYQTWLSRSWDGTISLRHWSTTLFLATPTQLTIRPYRSISSSRRLEYLAECGHLVGRTRDGDFTYRTQYDDKVTKFVRYIVVNHEGSVLETDWVDTPPWEKLRERGKVIRAAVKASYTAWAARPVLGCSCCKSYALGLVTRPATVEVLWEQLTAKAIPVCFWHTTRVDSRDTLLGAWRACLGELPMAQRTKALRQRVVRSRFEAAACQVLDAQFGAAT